MKLEFNLPVPAPADLSDTSKIWGTYYYVFAAASVTKGISLKGMNGADLGPQLSPKSWCLAGVEGTVAIKNSGAEPTVYNFAGQTGASQTSCAGYTSLSAGKVAALEKTRWKEAKGPYGDGAGKYILAPFRTLAVDRDTFSLGTVLYVPEARGVSIKLPDGTSTKHDGYFFAGDVGGAIKGLHVDFFLGITKSNPFKFITSASSGKFNARTVVNKAAIKFLKDLHSA